jgi:PPOX class probable F420-dependent enzyme
MTESALLDLVGSTHRSVLATLKRDGRPQLSNVTHWYDPASRTVRVSITADRAKSRNLERDPRASLHVTSEDFWSWAVVEGDADLSPVAAAEDDEVVEELITLYRAVLGEHPDWDDYRRAMVADRRRVVRLPVGRVYGQVPR